MSAAGVSEVRRPGCAATSTTSCVNGAEITVDGGCATHGAVMAITNALDAPEAGR
ncbi:hypothetical protein [Streptomyces sp. NPDC060002]|uniref:hypothetical protein n=1 Tax=Streptomyces sp. NPDC060002 TaxID=3347033 RepID=UPI0036CE8588